MAENFQQSTRIKQVFKVRTPQLVEFTAKNLSIKIATKIGTCTNVNEAMTGKVIKNISSIQKNLITRLLGKCCMKKTKGYKVLTDALEAM